MATRQPDKNGKLRHPGLPDNEKATDCQIL
jgi:hypothetical protein